MRVRAWLRRLKIYLKVSMPRRLSMTGLAITVLLLADGIHLIPNDPIDP